MLIALYLIAVCQADLLNDFTIPAVPMAAIKLEDYFEPVDTISMLVQFASERSHAIILSSLNATGQTAHLIMELSGEKPALHFLRVLAWAEHSRGQDDGELGARPAMRAELLSENGCSAFLVRLTMYESAPFFFVTFSTEHDPGPGKVMPIDELADWPRRLNSVSANSPGLLLLQHTKDVRTKEYVSARSAPPQQLRDLPRCLGVFQQHLPISNPIDHKTPGGDWRISSSSKGSKVVLICLKNLHSYIWRHNSIWIHHAQFPYSLDSSNHVNYAIRLTKTRITAFTRHEGQGVLQFSRKFAPPDRLCIVIDDVLISKLGDDVEVDEAGSIFFSLQNSRHNYDAADAFSTVVTFTQKNHAIEHCSYAATEISKIHPSNFIQRFGSYLESATKIVSDHGDEQFEKECRLFAERIIRPKFGCLGEHSKAC